jgi:Zn-dependent M28 family amino/carboxypeptidase
MRIRLIPSCAIGLILALSVATAGQVATVDAWQLFRDVEVLAADDMQGRRAGTPGGAKARAYILGRFKEAGIQPFGDSYDQRFSFTFGRGKPVSGIGTNVIGVIRGRRSPDRFIVVTAHYDHLGIRNGEVYNGAGDNATGVAALLAAAAHFSRNPPVHSILFAALDAEESGLHGARALVERGPVPKDAIVLNVNIDMIGRDAANVLYAAGTYHYPFLKRYLEGVAQPPVELRLAHDVPNVKAEDWTRGSDHYAFHSAGIPFVYFGVEDVEQHHKATDDSATIHKEFFAAATRTVIAAIERFDENLEAIQERK